MSSLSAEAASPSSVMFEARLLADPDHPETSDWQRITVEGEPVCGSTLEEVREELGELERDRVIDLGDFPSIVIARIEVSYHGLRD